VSDDVLALPPSPTKHDFVATTRARLLELAAKGSGPKTAARRQAVITAFREQIPAFVPRDVTLFEVMAGVRILAAIALCVVTVVLTYRSGAFVLFVFGPITWAVHDTARRLREPERERRIYAAECADLEAFYLAQASEVPEVIDATGDVVTAASLVQVAGKKELVRLARNTSLPARAQLAALGAGAGRLEIPIVARGAGLDRPWNTLVVRSPRKIAEDEAVVVQLTIAEDGRITLDATAVDRGGRLDAHFIDEEARFPVERHGYRR